MGVTNLVPGGVPLPATNQSQANGVQTNQMSAPLNQMVQTQLTGPVGGGGGGGVGMGVVTGPHGHDFATVINSTFDSLKTTLVKSLPNTEGNKDS